MEEGIKSTGLICLKSKRNSHTMKEVKIMARNHLLSAGAYQPGENRTSYMQVLHMVTSKLYRLHLCP